MRSLRIVVLGTVLLGFGLLLAGWATLEARRQRRATELALTESASLLATALGPGLVAASAAVHELDEIVSWKLLDNARLFAALGLGGLGFAELERLAEDSGLDSLVFLDSRGAIDFTTGEALDSALLVEIGDILSGRTEELILGSSRNPAEEHIAAAVARPDGGAVVVRIEASAARTFARRLGVENLLTSLAGTGGVLYLAYHEGAGGPVAEASWDGRPAPPEPDGGERLRPLRGRSAFEVEVPLETLPGQQEAILRVGLDGAPLERAAAAAMRRTLLVGIVLAAFAVAAIAFAAVSRLRGQERELAATQLAAAEAARRQSERLAVAGALAAGLAHEVRSPMNAIGLTAQRLQRQLPETDDRHQSALRIHREVRRLEGVLREFLELANPVSNRQQSVDLGSLGREVCALLAEEAAEGGVLLEPPAGSIAVEADPVAIRRATINLVRNALQATSAGGQVRVEAEENDDEVRLRVSDEGTGVDPEIADRVFDAFVTGRQSGTGLGLSLVRRVAEEHGGSVELTNRPQGGARAVLTLPRSAPAERARRRE